MGELCRDTRRGGNVRMFGVVACEHVPRAWEKGGRHLDRFCLEEEQEEEL